MAVSTTKVSRAFIDPLSVALSYSIQLQKKYPVMLGTIRDMQEAGTYKKYLEPTQKDELGQQAKTNQGNYAKVTKNIVEVISFKCVENTGIAKTAANEFKTILLEVLDVDNLPYEKNEIVGHVHERLKTLGEKINSYVEKNNGEPLRKFLRMFADEINDAVSIGTMGTDFGGEQSDHVVLRSFVATSIATSRLLDAAGFRDISRILTAERDHFY